MSQINFPTATTNGQQFAASNGVIYTYVGTPPNGYWSGTFQNQSYTTLDTRYLKLDSSNDPLTAGLIITGGDVGIGTTSPEEKLHIAASNSAIGSNWSNANNLIRIEDIDSSQSNGQVTGGIIFEGNDSDAPGIQAGIIAQSGSGTGGGDLAFHTAASGSTLDGTESPRMVIHHDGNVGIGTDIPNAKVDIVNADGRLLIQNDQNDLCIDSVNVANTSFDDLRIRANNILFQQGGTEHARINSNGNVGIGTSSPLSKLHVLYTNNTSSDIRLTTFNDTSKDVLLRNNNSQFEIHTGTGGNPTAKVVVNNTGNVGIGTTAPSGKLHVESAATTAGWQIRTDSVGLNNESGFYRDASDNYELVIRNGAGGLSFIKNDGGASTANLCFTVQGAERMHIASSGNVGIGMNSPNEKLEVAGNIALADVEKFVKFIVNNQGTSGLLAIDTDNNERAGINFQGVGSNQNTAITFSTSETSNATAERMRIDNTGNVGIGTSSPSAKLDVNGSLSKNSGSFKIDHPLPTLTETHYLVHSFVEAPDASNLYAGMVDLVDGTATVNIDTAHRMTEGTFEALNTIQSWSSSNESGYAPVKCSISGNLLTIECQDLTSTDTVYYEVRGIRKDQHMLDTVWTDENGIVITEPLKTLQESVSL